MEEDLTRSDSQTRINTISKEEFFSVGEKKALIIADPSEDGKIITFYSASDLEKKYKLAELDLIKSKFIQYELEPINEKINSLSLLETCKPDVDSDNKDHS